jgi:hypothetical protein
MAAKKTAKRSTRAPARKRTPRKAKPGSTGIEAIASLLGA